MEVDLTLILKALITLLVTVITAFVIPWIKQKITAGKMEDFMSWVEIAVKAAEQLYDKSMGSEKKQYVIDFLTEHGIKIDAEILDTAIESAVLQLHSELLKKENNNKENTNIEK